VPLDWAATQVNLGHALHFLGYIENSTARFDEAVAAYREALKEYTRDRTRMRWAWAQSSLARTLLSLGELERARRVWKRA
jgi:tetratricopeptide (TPR) repeat protein